MRKRFLSFALALCFVIPCMFFLASCGGKPTRHYYMTLEDIENTNVHFDTCSNSVKAGDSFTFGVEVGEGYDANKIVVSIDDEEVPLVDGQWYIIDRATYEYVPMSAQPKYPFSRKWVYTINDVQKNMTISVDASQVDADNIELSVSPNARSSKFYTLKNADLQNSETQIYSANLLTDEQLFDEIQINNGKIKFKYGKDLYIKIPEETINNYDLKVGDLPLNDSLLNESDGLTYVREEVGGHKYVFVKLDYWYIADSQLLASTQKEEDVENVNLVPIILENNPNFNLEFYKEIPSFETNAIELDGKYYVYTSAGSFIVDGDYKTAVFAYVGTAENIEDDPNYEPYQNYDYAQKKIYLKIDNVADFLDGHLDFYLSHSEDISLATPNTQNVSIKEGRDECDRPVYLVEISLPANYQSDYLYFKTRVKNSYLASDYAPLNLAIQGAYGSDPIHISCDSSSHFIIQDGVYYFKRSDIEKVTEAKPQLKFVEEFYHNTATHDIISKYDISNSLFDALCLGLEEIVKHIAAYNWSSVDDLDMGGVTTDEILTEIGEDPDTTEYGVGLLLDGNGTESPYLVIGYDIFSENTEYKADIKFIWLSKKTEDENPGDYLYDNYYYDTESKTWYSKVGAEWLEIVEKYELENCEKPDGIGEDLPSLSGEAFSGAALLDEVRIFDENAEVGTYKYYTAMPIAWQIFVRAEDLTTPVFAIVTIADTDVYYYDYSQTAWKKVKELGDDQILIDNNFITLRQTALENYVGNKKTTLLINYLKEMSTTGLSEIVLTDELFELIKGVDTRAEAENYKAYQLDFDNDKLLNTVLIVELGENNTERNFILTFVYDAYDGVEVGETDPIPMIYDLSGGYYHISKIETADTFTGLGGIFGNGLYYENGHIYLKSNENGYGFTKSSIFNATSVGNGIIEVTINGTSHYGSIVDVFEEVVDDSDPNNIIKNYHYVYKFESTYGSDLYFERINQTVSTSTYKFDNAYRYYNFETKKLTCLLYDFDSSAMTITQRRGQAYFSIKEYYKKENNFEVRLNTNLIIAPEEIDTPNFGTDFSEYEIPGTPKENFEFIENARWIYLLYQNINNDLMDKDAYYAIEDKSVYYDSNQDNDNVKAMYLHVDGESIYLTIFKSEQNGRYYLIYGNGEKWYEVYFHNSIPTSLSEIDDYYLPDYDINELKAMGNVPCEYPELTCPNIMAQTFAGQIRYLVAAQLGLDVDHVNYYEDADILEFKSYDSTQRGCIVVLDETNHRIFVSTSWSWYNVLYTDGVPFFLQKINQERAITNLIDFGVDEITDEITISYSGLKSSKSLTHKLIFDSILELGDVYIANDATLPLDQYVLSNAELFNTHYEKISDPTDAPTYFKEVNFGDEVYPETSLVFYSEVSNIYATDGTLENVYDFYTYDVIGQRPAQLYSVKIAHVRDIFGYDIKVEKDGKTFYLYVLNHQNSTYDDKDWTLLEVQQEQQNNSPMPPEPSMP